MNENRPKIKLPRESLNILLLGPGENQPEDFKKRKQILDELVSLGYSKAKLGEDVIPKDSEIPYTDALLSLVPDFDLILVLDSGPAPLVELATLAHIAKALQITKVWWKREYATGGRTSATDVVKRYDNWPYNPEEFQTCELLASFKESAERNCFNKALLENKLPPGTGIGLLSS